MLTHITGIPPLRSLLELFREIAPERSLLMSYAAPPLLVEALLLRHLQSRGAGEVTVLVDAGAYREALVEAETARWVGVHYEYYPVYLSPHSGLFHPKFYLLLSSSAAHLLISSANLSPSSLHENAEVVDHLVLNEDGNGDAGAFLDAHDFLLALLDLPEEALVAGARTRVAEFAQELERRVLAARGEDSGARLLHTGHTALLPQLLQHVPGDAVREIVVISPFFDPRSQALRELAKGYGRARLRVLTRGGEPTDLHHRDLRGIEKRLSVEAFTHPEKLRLHAKSILLRGETTTWILTGSPNLTAPAWCERPGRHPNVEVGVLRHLPGGDAFAAFGSEVHGIPIPLAELQGRPEMAEPEGQAMDTAGLRILEAVEERGTFRLRVRADSRWLGSSVRLRLSAAAWSTDPEHRIVWDACGAEISAQLPEDVLDVEGAIVVHLAFTQSDGQRVEAVAWVYRPALSRMPARERRWRRMISRLEQNGWDDDPDDYEVLLDFCQGTLDALQQSIHDRADRMPPSGERHTQADGDTFPGDPHRRLKERVVEAVYRVLLGDHSGGARAIAERAKRGGRRGERGPSPHDQARSARYDRWLIRLVPALFALPLTREMLDEVPLQMDLMLRVLLRRYAARLVERNGRAEDLAVHLKRILSYAFSLQDSERGRPRGWLVRAWMDESLRKEMRDCFAVPERQSVLLFTCGLLAHLTAPERRRGRPAPSVSLRGVLAGLCLAVGSARPWDDSQVREQLGRLAEEFAGISDQMGGLANVSKILEELAALPLLALDAVRRLLPLLRAEDGAALEGRDALKNRYRQLKKKPDRAALAVVLNPDENPACGACHEQIPPVCWEAAQKATDEAMCPRCGVVLTPFESLDPQVTELLSELEALSPSEWNP